MADQHRIGHLIEVIGPVVDVQFEEGHLPLIHSAVRITSEGFDVPSPIDIVAEVEQLSGRPALARGHAGPSGCTALPFDAPHLRALMIGSAELGEIVMRALILRRVGLIESGAAGTILTRGTPVYDIVRGEVYRATDDQPLVIP